MEMVSPVATRASIENVKRSAPLDGRLGSLYVIPSRAGRVEVEEIALTVAREGGGRQ